MHDEVWDVTDIRSFCASGARASERMIELSEGARLRLVTFEPAEDPGHPAVVFVPGWISQLEGWRDVLVEMSRHFRIYLIETREKISSEMNRNATYSVESIGDDILHLIEKLGLEDGSYLLFGSSLGATVILDCYHRIPEKPKCIAVVAPNAVFHVPVYWKVIVYLFYPRLYLLLKPAIKWYLKHFRLNVQVDLAQYQKYCRALDAADPFKLKKAAMAFWKYTIWDRLKTIDRPVLLISASQDKLHEPENMKRMMEMLPDAIFEDMGTNRNTHTAAVVDVIRRFLKDLKSS
jgi:pimeloyl-ACP methyl ester carboxylesterase